MSNISRKTVANQIIIFNVLLVVVLIVLYLLKGFDITEFTSTVTLLTSITAIYSGILFQFIGIRIRNKSNPKESDEVIPYGDILKWMIPLHFFLILSILVLKAIPFISFEEMNLILLLVESLFGGYMGHIIPAIFGLSEEKEKA